MDLIVVQLRLLAISVQCRRCTEAIRQLVSVRTPAVMDAAPALSVDGCVTALLLPVTLLPVTLTGADVMFAAALVIGACVVLVPPSAEPIKTATMRKAATLYI